MSYEAEDDFGSSRSLEAFHKSEKQQQRIASLEAALTQMTAERDKWLCERNLCADVNEHLNKRANDAEAALAEAEQRIASLEARCERLTKALTLLRDAWPDVRQLIEGWKCGTPAAEWSEWDEEVRVKTEGLSSVIGAALAEKEEAYDL
jgi:chromosome segregation ATPase